MKRRSIILAALCATLCAALLAGMSGCGKGPALVEGIGIRVTGEVDAGTVEALRQAVAQCTGQTVVLLEEDQAAADTVTVGCGTGEGGVRPNDQAVRFLPHEVQALGGNAELTEEAIRWLTENCLTAGSSDTLFAGTLEEYRVNGLAYAVRSLSVQGTPVWQYAIVQGERPEDAQALQAWLQKACAYTLPIVTADELAEGTPAFVFGSSGARSAAAHSAGLQAGQCRIVTDGGDLYFCAADVQDELVAMKMFIAKYVDYNYCTGIAAHAELDVADVALTAAVRFDGTDGWQTLSNQAAAVGAQENWGVHQGACSDGSYVYCMLNDQRSKTTTGKIVKLNMADWSIAATSEALATDHGNDMAYDARTGRLVVVHNKPNYTTLSIVDPETLTVERTVDLGEEHKVYSIGYAEARDQYILGVSGSQHNFYIADSQLQITDTAHGPEEEYRYTNQGCFADENYVYSVRSSSLKRVDNNCIFVNDWSGALVAMITVEESKEAESLFCIDDLWYITYNSGGCKIYETILYKEIT